ncbi:hypothetical protein HK101_004886 [Irineochytrium annulatum]|nr:hypothetical protein HK101_004886 [Irineochytrium annulatum]
MPEFNSTWPWLNASRSNTRAVEAESTPIYNLALDMERASREREILMTANAEMMAYFTTVRWEKKSRPFEETDDADSRKRLKMESKSIVFKRDAIAFADAVPAKGTNVGGEDDFYFRLSSSGTGSGSSSRRPSNPEPAEVAAKAAKPVRPTSLSDCKPLPPFRELEANPSWKQRVADALHERVWALEEDRVIADVITQRMMKGIGKSEGREMWELMDGDKGSDALLKAKIRKLQIALQEERAKKLKWRSEDAKP